MINEVLYFYFLICMFVLLICNAASVKQDHELEYTYNWVTE